MGGARRVSLERCGYRASVIGETNRQTGIQTRLPGPLHISTLEIEGVYAFSYWINNTIYLARDIVGIKPLWYFYSDKFGFCSEKKALEGQGYKNIEELNPRILLKYDIKNNKLEKIKRDFFSISENKLSFDENKNKLKDIFFEAIKKRIPSQKFGILFSGGIDSTLIAYICKKLGKDFICYTSALSDKNLEESRDLKYAKEIAKDLNLNLKIKTISIDQIDSYLKKIVPLIEDNNVVKVSVGLTMYLASELAKKDGIKVIFSGLGADDLFGGYKRQKVSNNLNKECLSNILKIYERDTYRDDVITMNHNLELRVPYLDKNMVGFALTISPKYKLKGEVDKYILRSVSEELGVPYEYSFRKKIAAQYGSKFDRGIEKLAKRQSMKKSEYLRKFSKKYNLKLGVLFSSGKDSAYALYTMLEQNYSVQCLISIISKNSASYMFHTPNIHLVDLQAQAMDIPLVKVETEGEKEKELDDLRKAIKLAKDKYNLDGIVTGALFSNYQRDRAEKICDELGLKIFSPLWHIDQELEMRSLLNLGFEVIISSVAAEGLDKSWLGHKLISKDVNNLVKLNKKLGINIAGEGGELETCVLDAPNFNKKIQINDFKIIEENENCAYFVIKDAQLIDK